MRVIRRTSQFKRDVKRRKRWGKDLEELKKVIGNLACGRKLEPKYRDHMLVGGYRGTRECHAPDWLLIYELAGSAAVLIGTGTHADLFE